VDRSTGPVELDVQDVGRHARDLEAAVYFCCVEALQNASKHAGPSATVRVGLALTPDGQLQFDVADDGPGFEPTATSRGNGFTNMRDRLGAFGGTIEIVAAPGRGTHVTGRVPVG
jgi:signal transduction histidine kinase